MDEEMEQLYRSLYSDDFIERYHPPTNFTPTLDYVAESQGVSPALFERLVAQESKFDPDAIGPKTKYGTAKGMNQLLDGTAAELGVTDPFNPVQSMFGGARYLKEQIDDFGEVGGVAAYNAGPGNYRSGKANGFPETRDYVKNITGEELPNAPDFSPSRYADAELGSASQPFSSGRSRDLSRVTEEVAGLEDQKRSALEALGKEGQVGPDEAIAIALTAILPTLLGFGFGGGLQGAAMGAQAGAAGANVGLQGMNAQIARRDNTNKLLYEDARQRITGKEAEARGIRDSISDEQFTNARDDKLYGKDGIRKPIGLQEFSDPLIVSGLAKRPGERSIEEREAIARNPKAAQLSVSQQKANSYGESVDNSGERLGMKKSEQIFQGYSRLPNAPVLTTTQLNNLRARQGGTLTIIDNLEQQKDLVRENGTLDLTGTEAAMQKALSGEFFNLNRIRTNSGANFTALEVKLIDAINTATVAGGSPMDAVFNLMTDRNAVEVIDGVQKLLQRSLDAEMLSAGSYREGANYSPQILKTLGLTPSTSGGWGEGEKSDDTTGTKMSFEEFKKRKAEGRL